jgi:hypothetical protein
MEEPAGSFFIFVPAKHFQRGFNDDSAGISHLTKGSEA